MDPEGLLVICFLFFVFLICLNPEVASNEIKVIDSFQSVISYY